MPMPEGMTAKELRTSADQLRAVLDAIDEKVLDASARHRAFIAGALHVLELTRSDPGAIAVVEQASDEPV